MGYTSSFSRQSPTFVFTDAGDGQVSFQEFKAMVEAEDPSKEDFLSDEYNARALESPTLTKEVQQRNTLTAKKIEVFSRCIRTCNIDTFVVKRMWDILRDRAYSSPNNVTSSSFYVGYDGFTELMPVFGTTSESHVVYDLIRGNASYVDGRELIMSFSNFVGFSSEDKCRLAFDMASIAYVFGRERYDTQRQSLTSLSFHSQYDYDRSGYLSIDEIEALIASTHLKAREVIKRRAEMLMKSADTDNSGGITIDELIVAAEKFPNLLFPTHASKQ